MNKKIVIGTGISILAIAIVIVGLKTTLGDKTVGLPGEEHAENALHLQESNASLPTTNAKSAESGETGSTESSESGP